MESIWNKTVEIPNKKCLAEDIHVKNVVIGAGMAGILTAWSLMRRGQEVIVLEANEIGSGQSGYTTAKITSQHGLFYDRRSCLVGKEAAREYAVANEQAIRHLEKIVQEETYYPDADIICRWSAQDCMPHDRIPFIGNYSIFRPQRLFIRAGIKNFLMDVGESIAGLTKGLFAAKDKRCRHMGCKLSLNPEEAVWECSCHGSSFYEDGRLKNNPSKKDLTGSF